MGPAPFFGAVEFNVQALDVATCAGKSRRPWQRGGKAVGRVASNVTR